jgi:hypothetical protein
MRSKYLPNYLAWRRRLEIGEIPFAAMPLLNTTLNYDRAIQGI